jgi:DNA-binding FadR family transcriptional regulator
MNQKPFDVERARLLIQEISADLAALPADSSKYAQLRAEVDALKAMLERSDAQPAAVQDSMKSVHGLFDRASDELRADGIRAGQFLGEIGRMLGLD